MKLSSALAYAAVAFALFSANNTCAQTAAPFVTFNNGQVTATATCTAAEMTLITNEVLKVSGGRRLGSPGWNRFAQRKLQLTTCVPLLSYATRKCGGRILTRRNLETTDGVHTAVSSDRELQTSPCATQITKFHAVLDTIKPRLSTACQKFTSVRSIVCREVVECNIAGINLWNADTNQIVRSNIHLSTGITEICSNTTINFEATTNFHLGNVKLTVSGDNGYISTNNLFQPRYFAFSTTFPDILGQKMQPGLYTFTAVVTNAPDYPKTFQFRVKKCHEDISGINFWDADTNQLVQSNIERSTSITEICSDKAVNFEATSSYIIGNVKLTVSGDNGYISTNNLFDPRYFAFSTTYPDILGQKFQPGLYTLTVVVTNSPDKPKTAQFRVKKCYEDISGINLWDADTNQIVQYNMEQSTSIAEICSSKPINFEATTNYSIGNVKLTVSGDNGYISTNNLFDPRYFAFSTTYPDILGQKLQPGLYTLTVVVTNSSDKPKTVQFRVKSC